jgi:hypothetical protein
MRGYIRRPGWPYVVLYLAAIVAANLLYAASIGVDSIDGTKWSRYTDTYARQLHGLPFRQGALA